MKGIIQSVSALVLGVSSLAFTASAQADSGLTVIYSDYDRGHRSWAGQPYFYTHKHSHGHGHAHKPQRYSRVWSAPPRHYHPRNEYGYGHRKHDPWHDRYAGRTHQGGFDRRDDHRKFDARDYRQRTHTGYARINRY